MAKLWYEEQYVSGKFSVSPIIITDKLISYFWGLECRAYNTPYKCPLGIYISPRTPVSSYLSSASNNNIDNTFIVNKVRVYFEISSQDFPVGRNRQLSVLVNSDLQANMV